MCGQASHGGDVAHVHRHRLSPYLKKSSLVSPKMLVFDQHIRREEDIFSSPERDHCGVIANPERYRSVRTRRLFYFVDQPELAEVFKSGGGHFTDSPFDIQFKKLNSGLGRYALKLRPLDTTFFG